MLQAITVQRLQALLIDMLFIFELIFGLISFITVFLTFFPSYYYLIYDFVESTLVPVFQFVYTRCDLKYTWQCVRSGGQAVVTVKRVTLRLIGGNNFLTGFNWSYAKSSAEKPPAKLDVVQAEPCLNEADMTVSLYTHGIVNTGNSCFLNSVLQALSSLEHLQPFLYYLTKDRTSSEVPVANALRQTLLQLTKPISQKSAILPDQLVTAISRHHHVINHEQQDAQELFQIISSSLESEQQDTLKLQSSNAGLRDLLLAKSSANIIPAKPSNTLKKTFRNPFAGLLASRLSCSQCGYTEAIRHFSFDNIQLTLPNSYNVPLEDCLSSFIAMETLDDVSCRSCSLKATAERLQNEVEIAISAEVDASDIEKLSNNLKLIQSRLQYNRVEDPIDPSIQLSRVVSPKSTKQVMFAKPPQCLCLHISRSTFHTSGAVYKNTCQVAFPETLDLSPYCTNSDLGVDPDAPISGAQVQDSEGQKKYQYRLMSTVVHYGSHNFGHFIAYKRRMGRCGCQKCQSNSAAQVELTQHDWYRVSDENVDTCPVQDVLKANPYMLIYELVEEQPPVLPTPVQPAMPAPSTLSHPTFKKSPTSSHITHSTMHKISMNKTVAATIQAATRPGIKLPSPIDRHPTSLYSLQ
ncbi:hypothetical protein BC943DRAFT_359565 [Umbelopsis sp. AD052]|nr:hypothetical protein BC943DRAFT_359565 [Umbelopsis sp. AD052]